MQTRLLRTSDLVIDVGANIGQFGREVRQLGCQAPIVSFEPLPAAFRSLKDNARNDSRWTVQECALGESRGTMTIHESANSVSSSLLTISDSHVSAEPSSMQVSDHVVQVSTLDAEVNARSGGLYLKIDTQGFELPVLAGGTATLDSVATIQLELSFVELYRGASDWLDVVRFVQQKDFAVAHVKPGFARSDGCLLQADMLFTKNQSARRH